MFKRSHWEQQLTGDLTSRLSELQAAHVLGQAVGFGAGDGGAGGHSPRGTFPRHLHRGPQQVDLFAVDVLHVVLREDKQQTMSEIMKRQESALKRFDADSFQRSLSFCFQPL